MVTKKVIRLLIAGFLLIVSTCSIASATSKLNGLDNVLVDFELLDQNSHSVKAQDFLGKYVLLGFGFTHCGHVCPVMAATMSKVLRETDKEVAGIFVSVDTERDTPAVTHRFAASFGENMLGLSGSYQQIAIAVKNFKASFAVTKTQRSYTVQHTSNIYVIDPEGKLVGLFALNAAPSEILKVID